jgi:hypothetical protein
MNAGEWYDLQRRKASVLWHKLNVAKSLGLSPRYIKRLERQYESACYVGD